MATTTPLFATGIPIFEAVFKGTSTASLEATIRKSNARVLAGLTGAAEQTEINRIQAAANELERRGAFATNAPANQVKRRTAKAKENAGLSPLMIGGMLLAVGGAVYWWKFR